MKLCIVTGSRADWGLLEWPLKVLSEDPFFDVSVLNIWGCQLPEAAKRMNGYIDQNRPQMVMLLGDRYEILGAATACHLRRIPIAHVGGGDVTEGSYDDAMRDCISRMASVHFVTSSASMARLTNLGYRNVHLVGSPGIDYIRHADWKRERPYAEPYLVVSYQCETLDSEGFEVWDELVFIQGDKRKCIFILPNPDLGTDQIKYELTNSVRTGDEIFDCLPHDKFLNLIYHCDEFIGNSSAMLYEAPELGIKTRMIGKRQKGRTIPWGDGQASQRIAKILKYAVPHHS